MLSNILSDNGLFDDQQILESLQEEATQLNEQLEQLSDQRAELQTKCFILEQINLDLSNKHIYEAQKSADEVHSLSEQLEYVSLLASMRQKYFNELVQLFKSLVGDTRINKSLVEIFTNKLNVIVQAKERVDQQKEFHLQSLVFERDNLQMELREALSQIDRLEQINRTQTQQTLDTQNARDDGHFDLIEEPQPVLQLSIKQPVMGQAKQKMTALKLGMPSLDFTQLKQVQEYKDWYGYSQKLENAIRLLRERVDGLENERGVFVLRQEKYNEYIAKLKSQLKISQQQYRDLSQKYSELLQTKHKALDEVKPSRFAYRTLSMATGQIMQFQSVIRQTQNEEDLVSNFQQKLPQINDFNGKGEHDIISSDYSSSYSEESQQQDVLSKKTNN